jgi:hypothetical protein
MTTCSIGHVEPPFAFVLEVFRAGLRFAAALPLAPLAGLLLV